MKSYEIHEIIPYKRRWIMLILFSLSALITTLYQMSFASISDSMLEHFNLPAYWVINLMSMSYLALNVPSAIIFSFIMKHKGLRYVVNIGAIFHCIAGWIRFMGGLRLSKPYQYWYWIMFAGQLFGACVQPALAYSITTFSFNWFPQNERALSTTIASFCNVLGTGVAFAMSLMVSKDGSGLDIYLFIQAIFSTIVLILVLLIFREKAPTPQSQLLMSSEKTSFFYDVKRLLRMKDYVILLIVYGIAYGAYASFLTLINQIITPKGYTSTDASIFGILIILPGILSSLIFGYIADKTKLYKLLLWICGSLLTISIGVFSVLMLFVKTWTLFIFSSIAITTLGVFGMPFAPIFLETAVEVCHPISPNVSDSMLGMLGTISGAIYIVLLDQLQIKEKGKPGSMQNALWVLLGSLVFAMFTFIFFSGKYNRMESERKDEERRKEFEMPESRLFEI